MSMPQDLVEDVLVDEAEKDQLRRELFDFLEEFRHKKNDEGEPLIQFPKNFDRISDAMTRQDLISTEDKTWSKYLLEEKFDQDSQSNFEDGRYSELLKDYQGEEMVNRGLAEIHLLDKQINNLDKQARQFPGSSRGNRKGKGRKHNDSATFITGAASLNGDDSSNLNTARSASTICSETNDNFSDDGSSSVKPKVSLQKHVSVHVDEGLTFMEDSVQPTSAAEQEKQKTAELRLEAILNCDEDDDESENANIWKALSRYGYTEESQNKIQDIDRQLSAFQTQSASFAPHLSEKLERSLIVLSNEDVREAMMGTSLQSITTFPPLPGDTNNKDAEKALDTNSRIDHKKSVPEKKEKKENVLQKQRVNRLMKEYEKNIDDLLQKVHTEELKISGLVSSLHCPPPPSPTLPPISVPSSDSISGMKPKKTAMQIAETTIIDRVITMEDVEHVIEALCYFQNNAAVDIDSGDSSQQEASSSSARKHRLQMDRLLATIRPDVERLANERLQHSQSSKSAHSTTGLSSPTSDDDTKPLNSFSETSSSYQRCLQRYMEGFAVEQLRESFSDTNNEGSTDLYQPCRQEYESGTNSGENHAPEPCNMTTQDNISIFPGVTHDRGILSRMTAQELKEANKKESPHLKRNGCDIRLQNIIQDIMAKKASPNGVVRDKTELVINLEHAHDKIQNILNRVNTLSNIDVS